MANALLGHEIRRNVGSARSFWARGLFVVALSGVMWLAVRQVTGELQQARAAGAGAGTILQGLPYLGRLLFQWCAIAQVLLLMTFVPALAGGAIAGERERRTLELLVASRLSARQIVWGKLGASLQAALLLILCSAPILSLNFLLGGVSPVEAAGVLGILAGTAVVAASVSLLCSTFFSRSYLAVVVAYVVLFALWGGAQALTQVWYAVVVWLLPVGSHSTAAAVVEVLSRSDPVSAVRAVFGSGPWGTGSLVAPPLSAGLCVAVALAFSAGATLLTVRRVRRIQPDDPGRAKSSRLIRWLGSRPKAESGDRWLADIVSNPVTAKDLRGRVIGSVDFVVRACYVGVILTEFLGFMLLDPKPAALLMCFWIFVAVCLGGVLGATSIVTERERQTWELMQATPMSAGQIVVGKFGAAFYKVQLLILLSLPVGFFAAALQTLPWTSIPVMWLVAEAYALAGTAIGILWSTIAATLPRAILGALLTVAACIVVPPWVVCVALRTSRGSAPPIPEITPLAVAQQAFMGLGPVPGTSEPAPPLHGMMPLALYLAGSVVLAAVCLGVAALLCRRFHTHSVIR